LWIEPNRFCVFFNYFSWVQVGWEIIPNETRFVKWSIKQTVHYFPTLNKFLWSVISQNDLFCNNIRVLVIVFDYFMMLELTETSKEIFFDKSETCIGERHMPIKCQSKYFNFYQKSVKLKNSRKTEKQVKNVTVTYDSKIY
jgi:hypothetical protein